MNSAQDGPDWNELSAGYLAKQREFTEQTAIDHEHTGLCHCCGTRTNQRADVYVPGHNYLHGWPFGCRSCFKPEDAQDDGK